MRIIARSDVERLLPVKDCIDVMARAMQATSRGDVTLPIRQFMPVPGGTGKLAIMPGTLGDPECFGIKLVCKYDRPQGDPLGSHVGMVLLFDSASGVPLAMIEGSSLTAIRTSAASALATRLLARDDSTRLAIIGTGEQAMRHVAAIRAVRPIESVSVWGRDAVRSKCFADEIASGTGLRVTTHGNVAEAVELADIICTTTSAKSPVLLGVNLRPGQHINLVGSAIPTMAEVDSDAVARSRFYVDYRPAALVAAGELLGAIASGLVNENHIVGEIGELASGTVPGRCSDQEITIYKSLGVASQDLAAAYAVWELAQAGQLGIEVDLLA